MNRLLFELEKDMIEIYYRAKKECQYNATRYLQLITERGGYETAKYLISGDEPAEGFIKLYLKGRRDITVEAIIVKEKYKELFLEDEINKCRERLK